MPIKRPPRPTPSGKWPVTITYLEMTGRPAPARLPAPTAPHAIIRAENPTVSFYRYLYDAVGRDWAWTDRKKLTDAALEKIITRPTTEVHVLHIKGVPAGFAELNKADMPKKVELAYFGLLPEFIGMKMGPCFLNRALEEAWRDNPATVTVNTCTLDHPKALLMYQRFGFQPIRQQELEIDPVADLCPPEVS